MKRLHFLFFLVAVVFSCTTTSIKTEDSSLASEVQQYLDNYTNEYVKLYYDLSLAQWETNTHIVEGDTMNAHRTQVTNEAFANFTGSKENIDKTRKYLEQKDKLAPLQVRQLETILYQAANNPQTVADLVSKRIKAETQQTEKLFGFNYTLDGKPITTNGIDEILRSEKNTGKRLNAWQASKEVGKNLKGGLIELRRLRNETVKALGYKDYFTYQVSEYDMKVPEMMDMNKKLISDIWPLYRELHTYARYELAKKYGVKEVPDMLPAHWLPNRWGQDWSAMIEVEGIDLDKALAKKDAQWLVKQAENFISAWGLILYLQVFMKNQACFQYLWKLIIRKITMPLPGIWICNMM
jgi:peptidyl-dipeptidase A